MRASRVADLQWYPLAWFANRLDIDRLHVGPAELRRLPRLRSTGTQRSILPGFDIRLMDLRVDRLAVGAAVSGRAHVVRGAGRIDIRSGRADSEYLGQCVRRRGHNPFRARQPAR